MEEMIQLFRSVKDTFLTHWPFISMVAVMTVVGQFTSKRLFTKERAYKEQKSRWFWYWGRESLPLHPIVTGMLLGCAWRNPEGPEWPLAASVMYFAASGVVSLFTWVWLRAYAKKKGITIDLPGDTNTLPPPPNEEVDTTIVPPPPNETPKP